MEVTYEEHGRRNLHLGLRSEDGYKVGSCLLVRETNIAVRLRFDVVNEDALLPEQSAMIAPGNRNGLIDVVLVLDAT